MRSSTKLTVPLGNGLRLLQSVIELRRRVGSGVPTRDLCATLYGRSRRLTGPMRRARGSTRIRPLCGPLHYGRGRDFRLRLRAPTAKLPPERAKHTREDLSGRPRHHLKLRLTLTQPARRLRHGDRGPRLVIGADLALPERTAPVRHGPYAWRQGTPGCSALVDQRQEVPAVPAGPRDGDVRREVHGRQDDRSVARWMSLSGVAASSAPSALSTARPGAKPYGGAAALEARSSRPRRPPGNTRRARAWPSGQEHPTAGSTACRS